MTHEEKQTLIDLLHIAKKEIQLKAKLAQDAFYLKNMSHEELQESQRYIQNLAIDKSYIGHAIDIARTI